MKTMIHNIAAGLRGFTRAVLLLLSISLAGCVVDHETDSPAADVTAGDKATVMLSVNMPKPTLPGTVTRARADLETHISQVKILVFEEHGGEYVFRYHVNGTGLTSSGSQTRFKVMLSSTGLPVKLMILANSGDAVDSAAPSHGMTREQVKHLLEQSVNSSGAWDALPMYGECELPGGIDATQTYVLPVTLLRAIARVDVIKDLVPGATEFILEEVYVYRANDRIQLIPDHVSAGSSLKVDSPSVPSGSASLPDPVVTTATGGTDAFYGIYIPESRQAQTNDEKIRQATTVIVGGRYEGSSGPVTYYRADFNPGVDGHPFGQVLRNHRYVFKIRNVSREGWPTPGEAAENLSSSINVEVEPWEDFSSEMYLGDDRFGISSRSVSLRYVRNREKRLDVESTYAYAIQWLDGGAAAGEAVSDHGVALGNGNFEATIISEAGDNEYVTHLVFRTLRDNHLGDVITDTLRITAGPWTVDVTVRQDNSAMYSGRVVNVLSVETVGNLGVNMVDPGASGLAMRRVMDSQFAPGGMIRIGGYSYTRIPNNSNYLGSSASGNLAVLSRIIGAQDVIYLPYEVSESSEAADMLLQWLEADPHRVLILGTDSASSNRTLRGLQKIAADGSWNFGNANNVTYDYGRAVYSAQAEEFFNGPFGAVSEGAAFSRADNIAGYMTGRASSVTPLITADRAEYSDYMFFGVNRSSRIVYHGDAQLFQSGSMSGNTGAVSSDLDRLLANTWAWIVEQVIYGDN